MTGRRSAWLLSTNECLLRGTIAEPHISIASIIACCCVKLTAVVAWLASSDNLCECEVRLFVLYWSQDVELLCVVVSRVFSCFAAGSGKLALQSECGPGCRDCLRVDAH